MVNSVGLERVFIWAKEKSEASMNLLAEQKEGQVK
jgi:hypothetical protein